MAVPVISSVMRSLFGTRNQRMVKRYLRIVDQVNALEPSIRALTDAELRERTAQFRARVAKGEDPLSFRHEVFAVAREAMDRSVGIRNVLNPDLAFDASTLTDEARAMLEAARAQAALLPDAQAEGDLLGCVAPTPAWVTMDLPNALYEAVRAVLPMSKPPFRARPFDVQIIGAIVLSEGKIAEMKTGEGKTIVAPLASYLAAVSGHQVHVVTVNDYLVQRDRDWTFPFFRALGLTAGAIHPVHMQSTDGKQAAYRCDVVYGTTAEFGFDYLRDNMKQRAEDQVQKRRDFVIVDEVDSILIDEARTPLIISGPAYNKAPRYDLADRLARHLVERQQAWNEADETVSKARSLAAGLEGDLRNVRDASQKPELRKKLDEARRSIPRLEAERDLHAQYYEVELDKKRATITSAGIAEAQRVSGIGSFYVGENMDMPHLLEQSVRAHTVYQRDRDYVIAQDETGQLGVVIVDQNTGRKMVGRQWSDGLHQAVEAKEGVSIKQETQTMATITVQNYFKLYGHRAGMTGTADTEAEEFHEIYRLDVVSIPTNLPIARDDRDDQVYVSVKDKWSAVIEEIRRHHDLGRPVLVGTTSVEKSEFLAAELRKRHGIRHEVLNAKQHEREAEIVAGAGQLGAVMIATNMAGRGTDIKLGRIGRADLIEHWKRRNICPREATAEQTDEAVLELCWRHLAATQAGVERADAASLPMEEIQLRTLRAWAIEHAGMTEGDARKAKSSTLMKALDGTGSFQLHRIGFHATVEAMGGLHIIGTERHESRRIDNQLRGRAGRQGDAGSSRFLLSLEDDLMKMFAGPATLRALSVLGMREGDAIEAPMLTRAVARAQKKVEERNFQMRKSILEYDEPLNVQRGKFYGLRQRILEGKDLRSIVLESIDASVTDAVATYLDPLHAPRCVSEWVWEHYGVHVEAERFRGRDRDGMLRAVRTDTHEEALASIDTALNEFLPDEDAEHLDPALLREWAQKTWGCELSEASLKGGRRDVRAELEAAMRARFDAIDTAALEPMVAGDWSRSELARWCSAKWNRPVTVADLGASPDPKEVTAALQRLARSIYADREVSFAIDAWVERTGAMLSAQQPEALEHFCAWARERHGVDWTPATLPSADPREIRERLVTIARERASTDPKHREELTTFEQMVLVQVLDATWKDHLHAMDQLRDSIGFRSFSQKDPRIEFKRESSRLYAEMELAARDRVTDLVFKGRLQLAMPRPAQAPMPADGGVQEAPSQPPSAPVPVGPRKPVDGAAIVGRNEPCPCGSGKKYGKCCGARQKAEA